MRHQTIRPGDGNDFSTVLSALLREMPDDTTLSFAAGEYHFWPDKAEERTLFISNTDSVEYPQKRIGILLEGKRGIALRGIGARLVFHGSMMALGVLSCEDITVSGFTIAYHCPTVVDGTVTESHTKGGKTEVVVRFPEVYGMEADGTDVLWRSERSPYTGEPYWTGRNGLDLSQHLRADGRVKRTGDDLFRHRQAIAQEGPATLRITYSQVRDIAAGDVFQMRDTRRDTCGIHLAGCAGVRFEDVNIQYMCSMGMVAQRSRDMAFERVTCKAAGDGMVSASAADMLHFSGCSGEILVRDCVFVNPHDDVINIHGTFLRLELVEGMWVHLRYGHPQTSGFAPFAAGDMLQVYDTETLLPVGGACRVLEVQGPAQNSPADVKVRLGEALRVEGGHRLVADNASAQPDVLIERCVFRNVPTRGVLVSTTGRVVIRGNVFERIHMPGVYISCDAVEWYESGPVRDVLIERNRFMDSDAPALRIEPKNTVEGAEKVHQNVRFVENSVRGLPYPAVEAKSTAGLVVEGNRMEPLKGDR